MKQIMVEQTKSKKELVNNENSAILITGQVGGRERGEQIRLLKEIQNREHILWEGGGRG